MPLPDGWAEARIGEVCVATEQVVPADDRQFVYVDIASVDRQKKKVTEPQKLLGKNAPSRARKLIRAGDCIVSTTRPNLNAVALIGDELDGQIASTGFEVLRSSGLDPRWLGYLVRTSAFVDAMSSLVQGALYPAVRGRDVQSFLAPIAPLAEQRRIADKLDTVLARVDAVNDRLARIAPLLKRFRQSVLAAATSGRLTEDVNKGALLDHVQLGTKCDVLGGKRLPKGFQLSDVDTGFPYVRVSDFGAFGVRREQVKFVPIDAAPEIRRYIIRANDVYISIAGSIGLVGRVPIDLDGANLTENAARIVPGDEFLPSFLMYQLASPQLQAQMHSKKIATTQDKLGLFRIKDLVVRQPPLGEQAEIVRRVELLLAYADRLEARLQAAQTAADRLTPALLAKAFRGELVPQDPNDEPASELLKRLAVQRAQGPSSASAGRGRGRKPTARVDHQSVDQETSSR